MLDNGLTTELKFDDIYNSINVAELLPAVDLATIANKCIDEARDDLNSCSDWNANLKKILEIVNQTSTEKNTPWQNAANVKLPLITNAAIQFAARTYPEVLRNDRICNCTVIGKDPDGIKQLKAKKVDTYMNYQLLEKSDHWEIGFDKELHAVPIYGTVYKKVYYDIVTNDIRSELCKPDEIIVNDNIQKLTMARRITHVIPTHYNEIVERVRYGIYSDILDKLTKDDSSSKEKSYDKPRILHEQHRWLDLDNDGYEEPYIVTTEVESKQICRIYRCFDMDSVSLNGKGEIKRIEPKQYFIDYHFLPSPDGRFHSFGFGQLLLHLNEACNTIMNQLLDAGTLNNQQSGFLGRAFRTHKGDVKLRPGKWIPTESSADDLHKSIVPMPTKEPSTVLLQLLEMLLGQVKDLASVTDMMQGQEKPQNVKAGVSQDLIEQGLKVYNSILKRQFRGLKAELKAVFKLNAEFMSQEEYVMVEGDTQAVSAQDFDLSVIDIVPQADPTLSSMAMRVKQAGAVLQIAGELSSAGKKVALANYLDALNIPDSQVAQLLQPANDPPSPADQKLIAEANVLKLAPHKDAVTLALQQGDQEIRKAELAIEQTKAQALLVFNTAQAKKMEADALVDFATIENNQLNTKNEALLKALIASDNGETSLTAGKLKSFFSELGIDFDMGNNVGGTPNGSTDNSTGVPGMAPAPSDGMVPPAGQGNEGGLPGQPS